MVNDISKEVWSVPTIEEAKNPLSLPCRRMDMNSHAMIRNTNYANIAIMRHMNTHIILINNANIAHGDPLTLLTDDNIYNTVHDMCALHS